MYSTTYNVSDQEPNVKDNFVIGRFLQYPDKTSKRVFEGGMRLDKHYKNNVENMPLVTIITTVFNNALVLEKSICSILQQSYHNIEYIVIDAASNDGTLDIIKKYDDVIDYIVSEPDEGIYDGMNKGLELAQGEYIMFLNSDDWYMSDTVKTLLNEILSSNLDFACALAIETDEFGIELKKIGMMPFKDNIRMRMPLRHELMLVSRDLYNKVGLFDKSYKIIGDLKMTQKIYEESPKFTQMNKYLMYFRKMGVAHRLTNDFIVERSRLLKEQFPFLEDSESEFLAKEFRKNLNEYVSLAEKYKKHEKLVKGIRDFLFLHGCGKTMLPKHIQFFNQYN